MERVEKFLKDADVYYLATMEGDQPRVRPFGTAHIFERKLYIQTGKVKEVKSSKTKTEKKEVVDLSSKTVAELKEIAKEKGIEGYTTMKKAELLEALK